MERNLVHHPTLKTEACRGTFMVTHLRRPGARRHTCRSGGQIAILLCKSVNEGVIFNRNLSCTYGSVMGVPPNTKHHQCPKCVSRPPQLASHPLEIGYRATVRYLLLFAPSTAAEQHVDAPWAIANSRIHLTLAEEDLRNEPHCVPFACGIGAFDPPCINPLREHDHSQLRLPLIAVDSFFF
jgi:hypothetical protein